MIQVKEEGRYDHSLWKEFTNGVLFPKEYSFLSPLLGIECSCFIERDC